MGSGSRRCDEGPGADTMKQLLFVFTIALNALSLEASVFNVRDYGAKGDGGALDSPAINAAIDAAARAGGGIVVLPPGTYLSFSIHLQSHITLRLDAGATLLAATPAEGFGQYDAPEPNEWGDTLQYQDFGHSHWHNSLIWGEDLEDVAIVGAGLIHGKGLVRNAGYGGRGRPTGPDGTLAPEAPGGTPPAGASGASSALVPGAPAGAGPRSPVGQGNKAIALKNCRNVVIRGISILMGGHFALLASGVDRLTLENLTIDTNRDGFDIDACQNVRIDRCRVNAPHDDAIVLKTSFGLGHVRATENVRITRCVVSGFDAGTLMDGTRQRTLERAPDRDGPTGRIKIGTESNGAFRNVSISDCVFERSRGLALETVDGGAIENVDVKNITMRDLAGPVVFLRLGNRGRGPAGTPIGSLRGVKISHVTAEQGDSRYGAILIAGLPGHAVEDVTLEHIRIVARGGLTPAIIAQQPAELVNSFFLRGTEAGITGARDPLAVPLREKAYPEPSMFGLLPAGAIYARHAKNLKVRHVDLGFAEADTRPRVVLDDVAGARFEQFDLGQRDAATPAFVLRGVRAFQARGSAGLRDARHESVEELSF
jgi:polygalacturonase